MKAWMRGARTLIWWAIEGAIVAAGIMALLVVASGCNRPARGVEEIQVTAAYVWIAQANLENYADMIEPHHPVEAERMRDVTRALAEAIVEFNRRRLGRVLIRNKHSRTAGDLLDHAEASIPSRDVLPTPPATIPPRGPGPATRPSDAPGPASIPSDAPGPTTRSSEPPCLACKVRLGSHAHHTRVYFSDPR